LVRPHDLSTYDALHAVDFRARGKGFTAREPPRASSPPPPGTPARRKSTDRRFGARIYYGMASRDRQVRVIAGVFLVLLGGFYILDDVLQSRRRDQPPVLLGVDAAAARVVAGGRLDNVRLTDLIVLCRPIRSLAWRHYGDAVGPAGAAGPHVLLEVGADEECTHDTDARVDIVGSLEQASRWLRTDPDLAAPVRLFVLRPHGLERAAPVLPLALILIGGAIAWSGLRRRRDESPDEPLA